MSGSIEIKRFPTMEAAEQLIPPGRLPYLAVRHTLQLAGVALNRGVASSLRHIANAQKEGILDPPLSDDLAAVVEAADSFIDDYGVPRQRDGFNYGVATAILEAVFEHGYRSDSA